MQRVRWDRVICVGLLFALLLFLIAYLIYHINSSPTGNPAYGELIVSIGDSNNQGNGAYYNSSIDYAGANVLQYVIGDGFSNTANYSTTLLNSLSGTLQPAFEPMYDGGHDFANLIGNLVALSRLRQNPAILVQAAVGSASIADWTSGLLQRAITAAMTANSIPAVVIFTWVHMDADVANNTLPADYLSNLMSIITTVRSYFGSQTPFLIGSIVPEWVQNPSFLGFYNYSPSVASALQDVQRSIPNLVPYTSYSNMLPGYQSCIQIQGSHFSATGQRLMAEFFSQAYYRAVANTQTGTTPNHPTGLYVSATTLSWVAPALSTVTGYVVLYKVYSNPTACTDADSSLPASVYTSATYAPVPFPLDGRVYLVDVSAVNGVQMSSGSANSWIKVDTSNLGS